MGGFLEDIYEKYHHDLFQFILYMVRNREQAEDLVHDVYIKAYQAKDQFRGESKEKTWLYSIARNVAIDWLRKQKRRRVLDRIHFSGRSTETNDPDPLPDERIVQNEWTREIYKCLGKLTRDQQHVLILRFIQSLSIAETAEVLNWHRGKVKTTQHRALKALRKQIDENDGSLLKGGIHRETYK